jgi:phytoene synthase
MTEIITENSREVIEAGSKSFATAARLFKREIRDDVYLLYAWCRHCDDVIDGQKLGFDARPLTIEEQQIRLSRISAQTRMAVDGDAAEDAPFRGLQNVVQRHQIPAVYPMELIQGFAMDVEGYRYETLEDTLLYCYHVAGVVGIMMAYVMGVRKPEVLQRAADLGMAFQLTNIVRDVMDDATVNRIYLPSAWLREAGVSPERIEAPENRDAVFSVVKRLLGEADRYYDSAREGLRALPLSCAWAISAADGVYHNIGDIVIARGARAWDERAIAPRYRKLYWLMRGGVTALSAASLHKGQAMAPRSPDLWTKAELS